LFSTRLRYNKNADASGAQTVRPGAGSGRWGFGLVTGPHRPLSWFIVRFSRHPIRWVCGFAV